MKGICFLRTENRGNGVRSLGGLRRRGKLLRDELEWAFSVIVDLYYGNNLCVI